jgi:hypothetical protein
MTPDPPAALGTTSGSTIRRVRPVLDFLPLVVILGVMLALNRLAPMMADDFCYAASTPAEVWQKAVNAYLTFNGRFFVHAVVPLFTIPPQWVFDVVNTLVFGLFALLVTVLARGAALRRTDVPWMFSAGFFLLWFGLPDFGQSMLWLMGAANYLWNNTLVLAYLVPYRFLWDGRDLFTRARWLRIAFPVFALTSGCTNENTAATAWLLAALVVMIGWRRSRRVPPWALAGLVGHALGFAAMVFSPGHHARLALPVFQAWGELSWIRRAVQFAPNFVASFGLSWILWLALVAAGLVLYRHRREIGPSAQRTVYFALTTAAAGILNNLALVAAPTSPPRAMTGGAVYLAIAALSLMPATLRLLPRRAVAGLALAGALPLALSVGQAIVGYSDVDRQLGERESALVAARAAGASEIVLDPIVTRPSRHLYWGSVTDITYEPSAWVNGCFARFAGFDSVRLVTPLEDGSSTVIGPEDPIVLDGGVVVSSVLFSRRHGCVTIEFGESPTGDLRDSFLDVRVLSDASPWYRVVANAIRRKLYPITDAGSFEYPFNSLRKMTVFLSFTIHPVFLDHDTLVPNDGSSHVFVPLTEPATEVKALLIGTRRRHDASMTLWRVR